MSAIYVVTNPTMMGIFKFQKDCIPFTKGVSGSCIKKFSSIQEALSYLSDFAQNEKPIPKIKHPSKKYVLYTDGSSLFTNGNNGGYASILLKDNCIQKEIYGCHKSADNFIMELTAIVKGIEMVRTPGNIHIYTDCQSLCNKLTPKCLAAMNKAKWKLPNGSGVPHKKLWKQFYALSKYHQLTVKWIKGHGKNEFNKRCDMLARKAAALQISSD